MLTTESINKTSDDFDHWCIWVKEIIRVYQSSLNKCDEVSISQIQSSIYYCMEELKDIFELDKDE